MSRSVKARRQELPAGSEPSSAPMALTADLKLRAVCRLLSTPHGVKGAIVEQLALECGRKPRTLYNWLERIKTSGCESLERSTRSDARRPRLYNPQQLRAVAQVAERRPGNIRAEFRALGLPGSYETFRWWLWQVRLHRVSVKESQIA
jgi:transposase